jgi:hypothetical protein
LVAAVIAALCPCLLAHADNAWNTTTQPPKLVWRPVRPSRPDTAVQDSGDKTKQAAKYEQNVFDDDPAPVPSPQVKLASGESDVVDASADASELPSVKARRLAQRPTQEAETLPPPTARELPPLQLDPQAVREPAELNPSNPMRMGAPRNSVKTYQSVPPTPQPYAQPDQTVPPDLGPGEESPLARPHLPEADCHDEYIRVKNYTLNKLSLDITAPRDPKPETPYVPYECSLSNDPFQPRSWPLLTYTWKASALCHKPLYFEEMAAERYGHSHGPGLEYVSSFIHFFGSLALLPYCVGVETPCECIYDLGYYRVGDCAPYEFDAFPLSVRGALTGAVGYCGVVALFP